MVSLAADKAAMAAALSCAYANVGKYVHDLLKHLAHRDSYAMRMRCIMMGCCGSAFVVVAGIGLLLLPPAFSRSTGQRHAATAGKFNVQLPALAGSRLQQRNKKCACSWHTLTDSASAQQLVDM